MCYFVRVQMFDHGVKVKTTYGNSESDWHLAKAVVGIADLREGSPC